MFLRWCFKIKSIKNNSLDQHFPGLLNTVLHETSLISVLCACYKTEVFFKNNNYDFNVLVCASGTLLTVDILRVSDTFEEVKFKLFW